ncbi:hypothetical protein B296_00000351 [Ensete ventricosum]|uniref:Uncharacterized protein n=1 Tax=Ensete ventricosum TaxID=4639 RepID=A0A427B2R3_ENSVE|nr:hypothetical protein B296_00000351 [Ensete ventricosum]
MQNRGRHSPQCARSNDSSGLVRTEGKRDRRCQLYGRLAGDVYVCMTAREMTELDMVLCFTLVLVWGEPRRPNPQQSKAEQWPAITKPVATATVTECSGAQGFSSDDDPLEKGVRERPATDRVSPAAEMIELEASSGIWRFREAGARTWSSETRKAKAREEDERCSFLEARFRVLMVESLVLIKKSRSVGGVVLEEEIATNKVTSEREQRVQ